MLGPREIQLVIELHAARPRGHLIADGIRRSFDGWLELLCALETATVPDHGRSRGRRDADLGVLQGFVQFAAPPDVELAEDSAHVGLDRFGGNEQGLGDLGV
jgi:hypothetical protein